MFIPVTGDQPDNAKEAERNGFGIMLPYQDITEKRLKESLDLILNDPKYTNRAKEFGALGLIFHQISGHHKKGVDITRVRGGGFHYFQSGFHDWQPLCSLFTSQEIFAREWDFACKMDLILFCMRIIFVQIQTQFVN